MTGLTFAIKDNMDAVAVVGAHQSGMLPDTPLAERGALLVGRCDTAPHDRLHALANTKPPTTGSPHVADGNGIGIAVEVLQMPVTAYGSFFRPDSRVTRHQVQVQIVQAFIQEFP